MSEHKTIEIPETILPRGYYARHVAIDGDSPRVLSGAELAGKAREYGGWYAQQRTKVENAVAKYGVYNGRVLIRSRWCRVWVDENSAPVRLVITEEPAPA